MEVQQRFNICKSSAPRDYEKLFWTTGCAGWVEIVAGRVQHVVWSRAASALVVQGSITITGTSGYMIIFGNPEEY